MHKGEGSEGCLKGKGRPKPEDFENRLSQVKQIRNSNSNNDVKV
jgi:hypothetical protein